MNTGDTQRMPRVVWMLSRDWTPDALMLLADAIDELRKHSSENEHDYISHAGADALLARFRELETKES